MAIKETTPVAPAAPAVAPVAASTLPEDDFDAVFDAITTSEQMTAAAPESAPAPAAPTPPPVAAATETPATPAAEAPAAPEAAAPVTPPEGEEEEIDWKARFEALEAKATADAAAAKAAAAVAPAPAPAAEAAAAPATPPAAEGPVWYVPSDDEKAILAAHEEQWPDISKAEAVRTKQAVYNAVQYVFSQMKRTYDPVLDRFGALSDAIESQLTLTMLEKDHSDYESIRDKVAEWVDTLPAFAKAGAKATMKDGTPEEVSELVTEYKKAHPVTAAATPVATPAAVKAELSPAAKKAASKLTVVDSKRTTMSAAPDPNDFDAAWAEASGTK